MQDFRKERLVSREIPCDCFWLTPFILWSSSYHNQIRNSSLVLGIIRIWRQAKRKRNLAAPSPLPEKQILAKNNEIWM